MAGDARFKTRQFRADRSGVPHSLNYDFVHEVAKCLHAELKPLGFTKRRHAWNRRCGDGLVQCIDLGMDECVPPHDRSPADAQYRSWSANYSLGAAVFFEEVAELWQRPPGDFITHAQCEVRWHHDHSVTSRWPIVGLPDDAARDVYSAIVATVMPWLATCSDREALVTPEFTAAGRIPTFAFAAIAARIGRGDRARDGLVADLIDPESQPGYRANIQKFAERLGVTL
jgi:hypothetical protein